MNKLKYQIEELKSTPGCVKKNKAEDKSDEQDSMSNPDSPEESKIGCSNCEPESNSGSKTKSIKVKETSVVDSQDEKLRSTYTSVWCQEGTNQVCQFENLCYNSAVEEFVMFRNELSTIENVNFVDGSITIDMSTVKDHNALQVTISSLPSEVFSNFKVKWVNDLTLGFSPFLPDNLMHMFHDDLIPMYHTLKLINMGNRPLPRYDRYNVQLFLFMKDNLLDSETEQFYSIFSKFRIKTKIDFEFHDGVICFSHIYLGLLKTTTWYDYGFTKPQGPLTDTRANSWHVRGAANYIRDRIPLAPSDNLNSKEYVVLFSRKENRKILNEMELTLELIKTLGLKVVKLDYDNYSLLDLIHYVSNSRGIIAMHGSLLILSIFLKPGSFVFELFPYAVNPVHYTPYKTLTELSGMQLVYKSWSNQVLANSIGHPDRSADLGGLSHLEEQQREIIKTQTMVPQHLCCNDPSWLYHIYQDTIVDSAQIASLVNLAISELPDKGLPMDEAVSFKVPPSKVRNVSCVFMTNFSGNNDNLGGVSIELHWDIPWTMNYVEVKHILYEILLQPSNGQHDTILSYTSSFNGYIIEDYNFGDCYVWVRAVTEGNMSGPYSDVSMCGNM